MKFLTRIAAAAFFASVVALSASPASAQFGVQAGYSFEPDQVVLGGHYTIPLGESGLRFVPGAEVAFGDDFFTIYANGDVHYLFNTSGGVRPYIGAGATWASYDPDVEGAETFDEFGANAIGGLWLNTKGSTPWFLEGKFGLTDEMADVKIMAGLGF
jgi:hypothetical protein